eukprot:TRINITY_DN4512_c0_g1_i8.p1 TRINITY_DN4512_c0_g1~~TRINITY_DN4512_c0_g1_i8.p1  ORF type:complete len:314 (+),score=63.27 TRINITY_DN4512_c0_g1_i8:174-1115(+)
MQAKYDKVHTGLISPLTLVASMQTLECPISVNSIYMLLRRLDIDSNGIINYVIFLENLKHNTIDWWAEFIMDHIVRKTIPKCLWPLAEASVKEKLIVYLESNSISEVLKFLLEYSKKALKKEELKELFKEMRCPMNNEDIAFIFHNIGKGESVNTKDLAQFIASTESKPSVKQAWTESPLPTSEWKEDLVSSNTQELNEYKRMTRTLEKRNKELQSKLYSISGDPRQRQIMELQDKVAELERVIRERDLYIRKTLNDAGELKATLKKRTADIEKLELHKVIKEKNREILMFKNELEQVLAAMEKLKKRKADQH